MSTVTDRVAAGAAFLDQHDPEWWRADVERAIDLGTLDIWSKDSCVLGQRCPVPVLAAHLGITVADETEPDELSGRWHSAYDAYAYKLSGLSLWNDLIEWAADHGFTAHDTEFAGLSVEWIRVITERRAAS